MATEPDDYQTISDHCPGYMVLVSEGIICTRCAGEKCHKPNECPKPATALDLATETLPEVDPAGTDTADSGMESLSETESVSTESTARSEGSDMQVANARQSDQGGGYPQSMHPPRRGFARLDGTQTSTEPDRTSSSPPNHRAVGRPNRVHDIFNKADAQASNPVRHQPGMRSRRDRSVKYRSNSLPSAENSSFAGSIITISTNLPSVNNQSSIRQRSDKRHNPSRSRHSPIQKIIAYESTGDVSPPKSLANTTEKFDYSNTTCPSSFGFGRLPSETMG